MKKQTQILFAITTICAVATSAQAAEFSPYLSAKAGIGGVNMNNLGELPSPGGIVVNAAFGTSIKTEYVNLRAELEYGYSDYSSSEEKTLYHGETAVIWEKAEYDFSINSYMTNFYVDFLENYKIKPFLGLSLGYSSIEDKFDWSITGAGGATDSKPTVTGKDNGFTYGLNAGFGFKITNELSGEFGTRYTWTKVTENKVKNLSATVGLRYNF